MKSFLVIALLILAACVSPTDTRQDYPPHAPVQNEGHDGLQV